MKTYYGLLLICSLGSVSGSSIRAPQTSWDDDPRYDLSWVEFHEKLFAVDGQVLDPIDTLNLLESLENKYKIRRDEESIEKYKQIRGLLHIAELNDEKCEHSKETFKIIDEQFIQNKEYPNVVAYLSQCGYAQYLICEKILTDRLETDVEQLPTSTRANLEKLKESMIATNIDEPILKQLFLIKDRELLIKGIAHYMGRQLLPLVSKIVNNDDGPSIYYNKFDELIKEPCDKVGKINIREIQTMAKYEIMLEKSSPFVRKWTENINLCSSIIGGTVRDMSLLPPSSFQAFLRNNKQLKIHRPRDRLPVASEKKPKKKGKFSLLSCLGCGYKPEEWSSDSDFSKPDGDH